MPLALALALLLAHALASVSARAALTPEQVALLPSPSERAVDFRRDIQPIFDASCAKCHGRGKASGGFRLDDRAALLRGGVSGPSVVPGRSAESYLIELVSGLNPDKVMPTKGSRLKPDQVSLLRAWIDQGLPWDRAVNFARPEPRHLKPRRPPLPLPDEAGGLIHPVDRLLHAYYVAHQVDAGAVVDDAVYARRVYLDALGLPPSPAELEAFQRDTQTNKRARLVERLLNDAPHYADHWLSFWNDLLRNDYQGTGYIDSGREQITPWLYRALARNLSYDRFVAQLINPTPASAGFAKGIVWRGVVNASQTPEMQAAQNISQVFLGVNLKCASCHDSFISDWTLTDAYGLASLYAEGPLEIVHCDKPTGRQAAGKFLYAELGDFAANLSKAERLRRLEEIMTGPDNGRLSRTIVNRLWARFLGRGLVEPLDDMEQPAWHPDLLDWLAADLTDHGYDLKHTMARILTSRAYQLPAIDPGEQAEAKFVFRGPLVRRLTAEQYVDAISALTGVWHAWPANTATDYDAGLTGSDAALPASGSARAARWIWDTTTARQGVPAQTLYLRKEFVLPERPAEAVAICAADNRFTLFVNGREAGQGGDFRQPKPLDLRPHLKAGTNVIAVAAVNEAPPPEAPKDKAGASNQPSASAAPPTSPAGFLCYVRLRGSVAGRTEPPSGHGDFVSDRTWLCTTNRVEDWSQPGTSATGWRAAEELAEASAAPWDIGLAWRAAVSAAARHNQVRAALVANDPLMLALGRPSREQVTTVRSTAPTLLQALELTNGGTLARRLQRGAEQLLAEVDGSPAATIQQVFQQALSRSPTPAELALATEMLGQPARPEGMEDLLWALLQHPEFQMIY